MAEPTTPTQLAQQVGTLWAKLGPKAKATLIVGTGLCFASLLFLGLFGGQNKQVLFAGLDPADAAEVVGALDGAKIRYELGGGGTIVRVAASDVDTARIALAEQDLPRTGRVGFELFQEQGFGVTDFAQQVNYRRALQGELERTISALEPVKTARVHLTIPEKAVFQDEQVDPSASVTLELMTGRAIRDQQVGAIRHLVAAGVEGLEADMVTVVDTKGTLLSRGDIDAAGAAALDYRRDLERSIERRVTRLLERTVGIGGVQVTASADVDFSRIDTTEEIYDPEQTAVRSESTQEIYEGPNAARPGGVAGATANAPGANTAGIRRGGDSASKTVKNKQYEVNRTVVRTIGPKATVKRMTVAVLVDGTYATPEGGGDAVFTPRSTEELAELQTVVENAAGLNTARGDRVKISSVEFRDRPEAGAEGAERGAGLPAWLPVAVGGGILAFAAIAWFLLARRKQDRSVVTEVLKLPTTVTDAQRAVAANEAGVALPEGHQAELEEAPETRDALRERVMQSAANDPERTADIIRAWMTGS